MLTLTRQELAVVVFGTAATVVLLVLIAAWCAWEQEKDIRDLRADVTQLEDDLDRLWAWACSWPGGDDPGPGDDGPPDDPPGPDPQPLTDEPDTAIAHPADTFARKQSLLARYSTHGQHRG